MQIQLQTIPPISRKLSLSLVKRSHERPCASGAPPIPKIPQNPANPASDNPPNLSSNSRHLSSNTHTSAPVPTSPLPSRKSPKILQIQLQTIPPISRQTLIQAPLRQRRPSHPENPPKKSSSDKNHCFRQSRPTQITAHPQYPMTSYKRCYYPLSTIHWCPLKTYPPPDRELLCYSLSDV